MTFFLGVCLGVFFPPLWKRIGCCGCCTTIPAIAKESVCSFLQIPQWSERTQSTDLSSSNRPPSSVLGLDTTAACSNTCHCWLWLAHTKDYKTHHLCPYRKLPTADRTTVPRRLSAVPPALQSENQEKQQWPLGATLGWGNVEDLHPNHRTDHYW